MPEAIDTAFVTIRPDTRNFASETRRQVSQSLRQQPVQAPVVRTPRHKDRDLLPNVGIRGKFLPGLLSVGTQLTGITAGIVTLGVAAKVAFGEVAEGQAVMAQTQAVLKSTGNVANVSAKGVQAYATELQKLSGIDDEAIQGGENIILTFKNVRNVGKGANAIFDQTVKAAVDLARFGGGAFGDINSASKQLGKALNDPIKGMTALSRSGITFSAAQKETIKSLVESGNTLQAQKLILAEVNSQVGGSAEAYGKTLPGAIDRLKGSISNLLGSGLERIAPDLGGAANAAAGFFEDLESGGKAGQELDDVFTAAKSAIIPLFDAVKSEGPRFASIFKNIQQIIRNLMPFLKLIGTVVGVTLVVAFKVAIRALDLFFKNIVRFQTVLKVFVQGFLSAIDGILGGLSFLTDAASHVPLIGDKFAGVSDNINAARDYLRDFSEELDATDGKQVNVDVNVKTTQTGTASLGVSEHGVAPDATGGGGKGVTGGATKQPGPRMVRENQLVKQLAIAQAGGDIGQQKALLAELIAFYNESIRLAHQRGVYARDFEIQRAQAMSDLRSINQQAVDDQKQAAEDAKANAAESRAAAIEEHRATLEANVQIASLTKLNLQDDKRAYAKLIAFLKQRVAAAKAAGVGVRAAQAELKAARAEIAGIIRDAARSRIDEQEAFLKGQVELFDIRGQERKEDQATRRLIAFYKKQLKNSKLTRAERQKYQIELARTQKDLHELGDKTKDAGKEGASFAQISFDFLTKLHGFASNLASNVMPRGTMSGLTESVVQARAAAVSASGDFFGPPMGTGKGPDGGPIPKKDGLAPKGRSAAEQAAAHREQMQGQPTAAQMERLLSQNGAILRVLRRIAQDQDHPEAKFNRKQSPASVVVGVS